VAAWVGAGWARGCQRVGPPSLIFVNLMVATEEIKIFQVAIEGQRDETIIFFCQVDNNYLDGTFQYCKNVFLWLQKMVIWCDSVLKFTNIAI
jgi:hypothetical protein